MGTKYRKTNAGGLYFEHANLVESDYRKMENSFKDAIFIDGLNISKFSRAIFEDMLKGGITAANCTCCVWDSFSETMDNISQWKSWFEEHSDLITQVYNAEDIRTAKSQNKVGIILGWQNTSGIDNDVRYLALFR